MYNNKLSTYMDILHNTLWIATLGYLLECMFYIGNKTMPLVEMWPAFALVGLSFAIYYYSRRFWIYLLGELAVGVLFFVLGRSHMTGYVVALLLSIGFQIAEKKQQYLLIMHPTWAFCGAYGVMYFMALFTERTGPVAYIPYIMMTFIMVTLIYMNSSGMDEFLSVRRNVKNVQIGQIKRNNSLFMMAVTGVVFALFIISSMFLDDSPIFWLIEQIKRLLVKLFKSVEELFSRNGADAAIPAESWEYIDSTEDFVHGEPLERPQTRDIPEFVYYILGAIITVIVIVFVINAVKRLIKLLIKRFAKEKEEKPEEEVYADEVISIKPKSRRVSYDIRPKTPSERVRRIYRKTILKNRRKRGMEQPDKCLTPSELEDESMLAGSLSGREQLHILYEKARYSEIGVTEEEENLLKKTIT